MIRFTKIESEMSDALLSDVDRAMQIDDEWCKRGKRGFTWWPGELRQRIWTEPVDKSRADEDFPMIRICARTDFLKQVDVGGSAFQFVSNLNNEASLSAYVLDSEINKIYAFTSVYVTDETMRGLRNPILMTLVLQICDVYRRANEVVSGTLIRDRFTALLDGTVGPMGRVRNRWDQLLEYAQECHDRAKMISSPFTTQELEGILDDPELDSVESSCGENELTIEFPFFDRRPASTVRGNPRDEEPETALFRITRNHYHPELGVGALLRLNLPIFTSRIRGVEAACRIGYEETIQQSWSHGLGGWSYDDESQTICHREFLPAELHTSEILNGMTWHAAIRTRWALRFLTEHPEIVKGMKETS